jgi:GDP-L-fucose synthase
MVGSALIRKLLEKGYTNIISTYHTRPPVTRHLSPVTNHQSPIAFIRLDLTNQPDTARFFEEYKPDYIFLAAAKVGGILANNTYKAEFIYDNMAIALNAIHSAYKYGIKKLLNLGSSCIYPKLAPQPLKEEYLLTGLLEQTNEPYAIAKIAAIKLCRYYNEQYGTNFISVMPTNLYGPNDNYNLETAHVLPALIRKFHLAKLLERGDFDNIARDLKKYPIGFGLSLLDNATQADILSILQTIGISSPITQYPVPNTHHRSPVTVSLWGSGSPYREFMHVDDLANACVFLMETYDFKDIGEFVNIGTGEDLPIKDLAQLIKEIVGFKGDIIWDTTKPDGTPRKLLDVSRIKVLGWQPEIGLEEGVKKVYGEMVDSG